MPISQTNPEDVPHTNTPPKGFRWSDLRPTDIALIVVAALAMLGTAFSVLWVGVAPLPNKEKPKTTIEQSVP